MARQAEGAKLVDSTRLHRIKEGPERRAMSLRDAGIDCINMHESDWTGGLTTLFHRFGVECFGWDAQQPRLLRQLLDRGVDAVYSDHVDRMVDALAGQLTAAQSSIASRAAARACFSASDRAAPGCRSV